MQHLINSLKDQENQAQYNDLKKANDFFGFIRGLAINNTNHQGFFQEFITELTYENPEYVAELVKDNPQVFIYLSLLRKYGEQNYTLLKDFNATEYEWIKKYTSELEKYMYIQSTPAIDNITSDNQEEVEWQGYFKQEEVNNQTLNPEYYKQLCDNYEKTTVIGLLNSAFSLIDNKEFRHLATKFTEEDNTLVKSLSSLEVLKQLSENLDLITSAQTMTDADELDKIKPFLTHVIKNVKILYQDRTYSDELKQINYIESKLPKLIEGAKKKIIERESEKIRIEQEAKNKIIEQEKAILDLINNIKTKLKEGSPDLKSLIELSEELMKKTKEKCSGKEPDNVIGLQKLTSELETVKDLTGFKKFWDNIKEFFKSFTVLQDWIGKDRISSFKELIEKNKNILSIQFSG